jgi:hypothetical protein
MSSTVAHPVGGQFLVVIDHLEAKVYSSDDRDAVARKFVPLDPQGHGRHLHSANEWTDGKRPPERKAFYESVAKALQHAKQILLFGSGTGRSNAMEQLLADLQAHHADIARKVVGSVIVDAHHTTENELLAKAREFYAALSPSTNG